MRLRIIKNSRFVAYVFACSAAIAGAANADQLTPSAGLTAEIDRVVSPYVSAGDFMGVIGIQRDNEPPLLVSYGLASIELAAPHGAKSRFLIGSISKQFTAAAILLLEQDGKLKTNDRVQLHLPDFKPEAPITIEQLLTHTSGVADVYSLSRYRETSGQGGSLEDVLRDLNSMDLNHGPGSTFAYSNGGYSVLAAIIERTSGLSYGDFLLDRIFNPLGMTSTSHDGAAPATPNKAAGYDPWGVRALVPVTPPSPAFTTGSGSLWSSASDLLTWNSALHGGRLLTSASYTKLTRDYGFSYGFGVSVFNRFGREVIGHDGRITGYASDLARYLNEQVSIVVLSNVQSVARDEIRRLVAAVVFDEVIDIPDGREFSGRLSDDSLAELAGVYSFGPSFDVTISFKDGRLLARANEGSESELLPLADGAWFSRVLYATVRFGRNDTGEINQLIWGDGNNAPIGNRKN
jgi:CubicO group peptidase (beta-lactamase class C family)